MVRFQEISAQTEVPTATSVMLKEQEEKRAKIFEGFRSQIEWI